MKNAHLYTRLSIWRAGVLQQVVEVDLHGATPLRAARTLRVWYARMRSLEADDRFTLRVQTGAPVR